MAKLNQRGFIRACQRIYDRAEIELSDNKATLYKKLRGALAEYSGGYFGTEYQRSILRAYAVDRQEREGEKIIVIDELEPEPVWNIMELWRAVPSFYAYILKGMKGKVRAQAQDLRKYRDLGSGWAFIEIYHQRANGEVFARFNIVSI